MSKPTLSEQLRSIDPQFYLAASEELMHDIQANSGNAWKETIRRANSFPFLAEVVKAFIQLAQKPDTETSTLDRMAGMRFALEALIACAESLEITGEGKQGHTF